MRPRSVVARIFAAAAAVAAWTSPGLAWAEPVTLPKGEDPSAWTEHLALAGLEVGAPSGGAWVVVQALGESWSLVVLDRAGQMHEATVPRPQTGADREELAWLASSLLRSPPPVPKVVPLAPTTALSPASIPPPPRPKTGPKVMPERVPEPVIAEPPLVLEPTPEPPPPTGPLWRAELGAGLVLAAERLPGTGIQAGGGVDLGPGHRIGLGVELSFDPATQLRGLAGDRWRRSLRASFGPTFRLGSTRPLRVGPAASLALRTYGEEEGVTSRLLIPTAGLAASWEFTTGPQLSLALSGSAGFDLRRTELIVGGAAPETTGRLGGGLGLVLRWSMDERSPKEP